jgi:selenoprotein W-related protein
LESKLTQGSGGVFEVVLDGKVLFSKKQVGRFPEPSEILDQLPAL